MKNENEQQQLFKGHFSSDDLEKKSRELSRAQSVHMGILVKIIHKLIG